MIAAVYLGAGKVIAEWWPRPAIGDSEVLLRLLGCGLCGSDIAKIVDPSTPVPLVLGHEVVGEIVALGPDVTDCAIGDRVVAAHHVPCGDCHYCRRGSESMCRAFKASNLDPGGFAEYVRVPAPNVRHALFRVPRHVTDEAASFVEPLACCLRSVRRARVAPGDTVAVRSRRGVPADRRGRGVRGRARHPPRHAPRPRPRRGPDATPRGAQGVRDAMRAMVFHGPGDLRAEELPVPEPETGELVLRVDAALTCGTDVKTLRRGHPVMIPKVPTVFGHEFAGTITAVGAGVRGVREGEIGRASCRARV